MPGEHDHRLVHPLRGQLIERGQATEPWHADVHHDGSDALAVKAVDEALRIGPGVYAQAHGADQQRQGTAHGFIVVDQVN